MSLLEFLPLLKLILELMQMATSTERDREAELRHLFSVIRASNDLYARSRFGA